MTLVDLAEIDCRTDDVKLQLVKLIESTIQLTSVKSQLPLASLLPYLVTLDDTAEFLSTFNYIPLDFAMIRIRLLSSYYNTFYTFIKDVQLALDHYEKIREPYGLPNIQQQAKDQITQGITNLPFTQFLHQPFDFQLLLENEPIESIKTLQINEVALFFNLLQDFDSDQITKIEQVCTQLKVVENDQVQLSKSVPRLSRKVIELTKSIAVPGQIETAKRRIKIADELSK
ncbi:hypothetical protein SS50377_22250 [Spironucleus salmonicida]|uniref:Uncharacterized protein n=1 Tax=Spironucleus salmonicida TaxID=348837 RepID=V6LCT2_9EUKA|nr:hypothetical protein SS50377_22250 [Spironucleus salmonicida]|eukprot:EST42257.1 Hypothetical protein SS50377_18557 [Spironucleus salmonicida]